MKLQGIAVSAGIAIEAAQVYVPFQPNLDESLPADDAALEQRRFADALAKSASELAAITAQMGDHPDKAAIFAAHQELLDDPDIDDAVASGIAAGLAAESAVNRAYAEFISLLAGVSDPLIAGRVADLRDLRNRLLRNLAGLPERSLAGIDHTVVVVAHDLLPSDTATLDRAHVAAIVTEVGSATSHCAIIANSYRIPAVLGVSDLLCRVADGDTLGVDAIKGDVYVNPSDDEAQTLEAAHAAWLASSERDDAFAGAPCVLADGTRYQVGVNIGGHDPSDSFTNCDFVGLLRTEFLYMEAEHLPSESEQLSAYRQVLSQAQGRPLTLRTLDIGGDKTLSYFDLPHEDNPFLGVRAVRLCFEHLDLFVTQLRAVLRASAAGPLQVMIPMVGSLDDIRRARAVFDRVKADLKAEGLPIGSDVSFGIMIEVPTIAVVADLAAAEVDFGSIGTNDLTQYLCAADRMNPAMGAYAQSYGPAMVRLLGRVIGAFNAAGKPISVCGEMAGDPIGALLLVGLGCRKLSMSPAKIASVKAALSRVTLTTAEALAAKAQTLSTENEVIALLKEGLNENETI